MGDQPHIAVVGSTMIDLIAYTARVPQAGETIQAADFLTEGQRRAILYDMPLDSCA